MATANPSVQLGREITTEESMLLQRQREEREQLENELQRQRERHEDDPEDTPRNILGPSSSLSPPSPTSPLTPLTPRVDAADDEEQVPSSPDLDNDGVEDQDGAQAVLQPAMSAAAVHLTSPYTPAIEKAAALEKAPGGGLFGVPLAEDDDVDDEEETNMRSPLSPTDRDNGLPTRPAPFPNPTPGSGPASMPAQASTGHPRMALGQLPPRGVSSKPPMPSPWSAGPKSWVVGKDTVPVQHRNRGQSQSQNQSRLLPSRAYWESAFGPTRNRSRSAGQDALKRLQKAFPSFSTPSHLLSSFQTSSFFSSSSTEKSSHGVPTNRTSPNAAFANARSLSRDAITSSIPRADMAGAPRHTPSQSSTGPHGLPRRSNSIQSRPTALTSSRPPTLRRVTSDESILYHSLSRASSLGDDDQFQDVRAMVNMRLQAIKESLPEVPNFKMPSLPKIHTPSFISMNSFGSTDGFGASGVAATADRSAGMGTSSSPRDGYTDLDGVLEHLTGDLVIMGGFRGSVLRSAEPPHQQCWAPVKLGFNMRKVNLEVGLEDEDEENMENTIIPSGMLSHIGPIDISRKLLKKVRNCENARTGKLRVWDYGYDWRLSPALLSRKLREFLEKLPSNQPGVAHQSRGAIVIAHSLGGMITRHAVNQRPDLFAGVLYAGVPQRCINILGPLRNGDVVLLNEKLLSAQVNFSMRTSFVFLPEDGFCFVDKNTQEEYPIDFYDAQQWVKWHLSPCVNPALPSSKEVPSSLGSPSLSSFIPNSLRARAESSAERWFGSATLDPPTANAAGLKDRTIAPQMYPGSDPESRINGESSPSAEAVNPPGGPSDESSSTPPVPPSDPERARYVEYLTRVLAATKKFRSEVTHRPNHQESNVYPPLAVIYGKSTPTVYAAQVNGREGIPCADAYDDLLFRAGDGVVLAKEAMLPEGYSVVKGGRVCTERGHITMLGDMNAVGRALNALVRGRRKGIGLGNEEKRST